MNLSIKPIAAAISLALVSASAHAALAPPSQGAANPGANGLYLEAWNATTGATELVNLSYVYTDITGANLGNLNTPSSVFTTTTDPAGSGNTVSQLNFGVIANASAGAFTNYTIVSGATATQTGLTSIEGATIASTVTPTVAYAGLGAVIQNIQGEIANWTSLSSSGTYFDATGSTTIAALIAPSSGGTFNNAGITPGTVGSAIGFYNILGNTSTTTKSGIGAHQDTTTAYAGYWFLNSSGDLTYNITQSTVPLPPAVWLFGGGLLGMIGIGRRRRAAA